MEHSHTDALCSAEKNLGRSGVAGCRAILNLGPQLYQEAEGRMQPLRVAIVTYSHVPELYYCSNLSRPAGALLSSMLVTVQEMQLASKSYAHMDDRTSILITIEGRR